MSKCSTLCRVKIKNKSIFVLTKVQILQIEWIQKIVSYVSQLRFRVTRCRGSAFRHFPGQPHQRQENDHAALEAQFQKVSTLSK